MHDRLRILVDDELKRFLGIQSSAVPESEPLVRELARLIQAGGKRLRPAFCYWGYRAASNDHHDEIVRASAALELLHTFAIIHDDIMDASDERRGVPSTHATHGVEIAILAGDLALVLADDAFMRSGFPVEAVMRAFTPYSRMCSEVIGGQYLDLVMSDKSLVDESEVRRVAKLKSGRYSVEKPLLIGASLGAADRELLRALSSFGEPLGEAFQLRDDLLGTFGERSVTGKPVDSDIRQGKRNMLYAKTVALLTQDERDWFIDHWGASDLDDAAIERIRLLVEGSGARFATQSLLESLLSEALERLARAQLEESARDALRDLAEQVTTRVA